MNIILVVIVVLVVAAFILVFHIQGKLSACHRSRRPSNTAVASHDRVSIDRRQSRFRFGRCESAAVIAAVIPVGMGLINTVNTPTIRV